MQLRQARQAPQLRMNRCEVFSSMMLLLFDVSNTCRLHAWWGSKIASQVTGRCHVLIGCARTTPKMISMSPLESCSQATGICNHVTPCPSSTHQNDMDPCPYLWCTDGLHCNQPPPHYQYQHLQHPSLRCFHSLFWYRSLVSHHALMSSQ